MSVLRLLNKQAQSIKKSSYLYYSKQAIEAYGKYIETIASEEHLQAHANAAKVRMK